ncbi:MAG: transglutaminase family protein [Geminicoccaceae bacterium]
MHLHIRHRTVYRYQGPISHATQIVRMTPRPFAGLRVINWRLKGETRRPLLATTDGFDNILHVHNVQEPKGWTAIFVEGEVETTDTHGVVGPSHGTLPPPFFLRTTAQTSPTPALAALARGIPEGSPLDRLHELMSQVRDRIDYRIGITDVATTAARALELGGGVCQDHAHVFIACARIIGIPARYVSGYLFTGRDDDEDASHAWAEAWIEGLGWVGFDPSNRVCPGECYVRTATGLDYWSAAPVRGIWGGAGRESLEVKVRVEAEQSQQ